MSSETEGKIRVKVDDELEFLMTQEQLRLMEIAENENDSFYSCATSSNETYFEEFDSAMSLMTDHSESAFVQEYEDITPVPSEGEATPSASFSAEGDACSKATNSRNLLSPSPRKLQAIALVTARFNLIHPAPKINILPPSPTKVAEVTSTEVQEDSENLRVLMVGSSGEDISGSNDARPIATPSFNDAKVASATNAVECVMTTETVETATPATNFASLKSIQSHLSRIKSPTVSCSKRIDQVTPIAATNAVKISVSKSVSRSSGRFASKQLTPKSIETSEQVKRHASASNDENTLITKCNESNTTLDISGLSSRLVKNPGPKKLQEQSFKGSPVRLSKLITPNKSKVTSKVAEFIKGQATQVKTGDKAALPLRSAPAAASRIPKKCFHQSARLFGKQLVPNNLMNTPKPVITIHKHLEAHRAGQIHINESVYETFEAEAAKKN